MRVPPLAAILLVAVLAAACTSRPPDRAAEGGDQPATPAPEPATPEPEPVPEDPWEAARYWHAAGPEEAAQRIERSETLLRDDATPAAEHARLGIQQQAAYRQLVANPEWIAPVLERVPERLHHVVRANVEADEQLRGVSRPRDTLPDWQIVAPPPADDLLGFYREAEREFGVHWSYLASIHLVETRMGRIRGTSIAGAQGPMQFMPGTWTAYGEGDVNDPRDAIMAAGRYLRASGAPDDMAGALFAYNRSQRYVRAITIHADLMRDDERAFRGYYHWQVYYRTPRGDALLQEGYGA